jgi:hypothetical protein
MVWKFFLPFTDCAPDIQEHNAKLFGPLHVRDIWRNYWNIVITWTKKSAKNLFFQIFGNSLGKFKHMAPTLARWGLLKSGGPGRLPKGVLNIGLKVLSGLLGHEILPRCVRQEFLTGGFYLAYMGFMLYSASQEGLRPWICLWLIKRRCH